MTNPPSRTICWIPTWNRSLPGVGLEHLLLTGRTADGVVLAVDDDKGPFRLAYRLHWDEAWRLHAADVDLAIDGSTRSLALRSDGRGRWHDGDGCALAALDGCIDIDLWPTPFTNSFPIRRQPPAVGERRTYRMAWVSGTELTVHPQEQAYTRLRDRHYLFEALDGSGFTAELPVDEHGIVLDYPGLFRRVAG